MYCNESVMLDVKVADKLKLIQFEEHNKRFPDIQWRHFC